MKTKSLTPILPLIAFLTGSACNGPATSQDMADCQTGIAGCPNSDFNPPSGLPECTAQRSINLVAGGGGFAWFTLIWPVPFMIENFMANFAYDDLAKAGLVTATGSAHPLYARKVDGAPLWAGRGASKQVSALLAGAAIPHTYSPTYNTAPTYLLKGVGGRLQLFAAQAALQTSLGAQVPVVSFRIQGYSPPYGPALGAPNALEVGDVNSMISQMVSMFPSRTGLDMQLRPDPAKLQMWYGGTDALMQRLAQQLLLAVNAFRIGLVSQVNLPAVEDDLHGPFSDGFATQRTDALARLLDLFMAELASAQEPACVRGGQRIPLADNVVLTVHGDAPKDPYMQNGWPDYTRANWIYVLSNGYMKPGWFGKVLSNSTTNFDPATGDDSFTTSRDDMTSGALGAVLYATARGNVEAVNPFYTGNYQGLTLGK